jgi:hypothetical protein
VPQVWHFVSQPQVETVWQPQGSAGASATAVSQGAEQQATGSQHLFLRTFLHLAGLHLLRLNSPADAWFSLITAKPAITTIKAVVHVIARLMIVFSSEQYTCW